MSDEQERTSIIPDLRGRSTVEAGRIIRSLGLRLGAEVATVVDGGVDLFAVTSSEPPGGTEVPRLTAVSLTVNSGTDRQLLQAAIDGPRDVGNAVVLPPGRYLLDAPLLVTRWRTRVRREGSDVRLIGDGPVFVFDDDAVDHPDRGASVVFTDDPEHELTSKGTVPLEPVEHQFAQPAG